MIQFNSSHSQTTFTEAFIGTKKPSKRRSKNGKYPIEVMEHMATERNIQGNSEALHTLQKKKWITSARC